MDGSAHHSKNEKKKLGYCEQSISKSSVHIHIYMLVSIISFFSEFFLVALLIFEFCDFLQ